MAETTVTLLLTRILALEHDCLWFHACTGTDSQQVTRTFWHFIFGPKILPDAQSMSQYVHFITDFLHRILPHPPVTHAHVLCSGSCL